MKGPLDVHRELLSRDVPHEVIRLPRTVFGADDLPEALGLPAERCVAVRMYEGAGRMVAVLVPAGRWPDPVLVGAAAGIPDVRPAAPGRVNAVTDFAASLVAPLPLPADLPALCDLALVGAEVVYAPTGDAGTALGIPVRELLAVTSATVVDLAAAAYPTEQATTALPAR